MRISRNAATTAALAAGAICLTVYLRALSCDFINYDDPLYVVENPAIRLLDWEFIKAAFSTSYMGWWMPLTWISFALDYQLWELNPLGYHLTNILLHALNTVLVVLIAHRLVAPVLGDAGQNGEGVEGDRFFYPGLLLMAGLLFGIHPLRVESVVWVTERKDVLNGVFALGSILCYLRYAQKRDAGHTKGMIRDYLLSLVFLLLSLMAKPVSVVIPAMLLVADWYPLGRLRRGNILPVLTEKVPFLVISAALAIATIYFAAGETILVSFHDFPLYRRAIVAGNAIFEYCRLSFFPARLIVIYLLPKIFPLSYYVHAIVVVVFTAVCLFMLKKRAWLLATWAAFLLPLLPVLGFFQNGAQAYADRFTYLPSVAPSIAAATVLVIGYRKLKTLAAGRRLPGVLCAVLIAAIPFSHAVMTERLIGSWKSPETLWSRVIATQAVGRAFYYRADYRMRSGNYLGAMEDLTVSIAMGKGAGFPGIFNLQVLRGDVLVRMGRYEEAVRDFTAAIERKPHPSYFYHQGYSQLAAMCVLQLHVHLLLSSALTSKNRGGILLKRPLTERGAT